MHKIIHGSRLILLVPNLDFSIIRAGATKWELSSMTERVDYERAKAAAATKVWSVTAFCQRHRLDNDEERRLKLLFGEFATACELLHNAQRSPRWHH